MAMVAEVAELQVLPLGLLASATYVGCLNEAARHSGLDDHEIAESCHVSAGYFSRFMRSVGVQQAKRLVAFMRATRSLAPLQWLAHQMGCDLVMRSHQAERISRLEQELRDLRQQGRVTA